MPSMHLNKMASIEDGRQSETLQIQELEEMTSKEITAAAKSLKQKA